MSTGGGDVHTTFTGDDAQIQRVLQRLEDQNTKLIAQNRLLGRQVRDTGQAAENFATRQISQLTSMAVGYVSVQAIVAKLVTEYDRWDQRLVSIGNNSRNLARNTVLDAAAAGDLMRQADVDEFIAKRESGTRDQARQAYIGASGGTPTAPIATRFALANEALRAAPIVDDLKSFGRLLGEIHDVFPAYKPGDVGDLALALREEAGVDVDKLTADSVLRGVQSLIESGAVKSPEQGFAYGVAAIHANLKPEIVMQLSAAVQADQQERRPTPGQRYTKQDRAFNRFVRAEDDDKLRLLHEDAMVSQEVLGKEIATRLKLIRPENVDAIAARLVGKVEREYSQELIGAVNRTPTGSKVLADQRLTEEAERATQKYELEAEQTARTKKFFQTQLDKHDPWGWDWTYDFAFGFQRTADRANADIFGGNDAPILRTLAAFRDQPGTSGFIPDAEMVKFLQQERSIVGPGQQKELERLLEEVSGTLKDIKENTRQIDRGPPPVINAHTETR